MSEGPRLALTIVAAASRLVPSPERGQWRLEWEGELLARWDELARQDRLTAGARVDLLSRALGSVPDALLYSRGRWRMGGVGQDLMLAFRGLRRAPGFVAVIVLTLALGIGACTALFGVASDVLLRPFPYPDPDKVVAVRGFNADREGFSGNVSYPNLADLEEAAESFVAIAAARWWAPALEGEPGSVVVTGATVTSDFFDVLGVEPAVGRFFQADEATRTGNAAVVLSHSLWLDRFGADPAIVGRDLRLDGEAFRVIGVTRADHEDPWAMAGTGEGPKVWRPVATPPSEWPRSGRSWSGLGRVRSDVTVEAAQAELDGLFVGLTEAFPEANSNRLVRIDPIRDVVAGPARPALLTLLGSVALLLLIACANLANLLLGRALDRHGELAVLRALGASEGRIVRRSLAEALLLATAGGALGLALAVWLGHFATRLGPILPRPVSGQVDLGALAFALAATLGCALLIGTAPAVHASSVGVAQPGRGASRGATAGRRGQRLRRALVVGEVALTTTLLVASGLLLRSFQRLGAVDVGLETREVVAVDLHGSAWWSLDEGAASTQWNDVLEAVRGVPGVEAAGAIDYVPLSGSFSCDSVRREDRPPPAPGEGRCAEVRVVLPGALEALRVPLVRGRMLDDRDGADAPRVVVVDQNLADELWPGDDPIGARVAVHNNVHEVVGIVANIRNFGPAGAERPMLYLHAPQEGWNGITRGLSVLARGAGGRSLVAPIVGAVGEVSRSIAIGETRTLAELLRRSLATERFRAALMGAFGLTALILAVLGLVGVMAFSVARRTRELGVRLALGARPSEVRLLVLREGARLSLTGVGLGVVGALGLARLLDSVVLDALLFQTDATDPWVYVGVSAALTTAALVGCYLPALRASRVDPRSALAAE